MILDRSCGQRDRVSALAPGHRRSVALEWSLIYILNSASVMSLMECGHPGTFPLRAEENRENVLQPVIELSSLSWAIEDVGLDALWLAC